MRRTGRFTIRDSRFTIGTPQLRRLLPFLLVALLPALVFVSVETTRARADATFETSTVENGYPKNLTFKLVANAPIEIKDVTLTYSLSGRGPIALAKPEPNSFTPGTKVTTSVIVDTNPNTNWLPVGN